MLLLPVAGIVIASSSSVGAATTVTTPFAQVQGCEVTFGNVPEGSHVKITQGTTVVADPASNPAILASGTYSWDIVGVGENYQTFTILPGCPPPTVLVSCGGTVIFSGIPEGWELTIKDAGFQQVINNGSVVIKVDPGTYSFSFSGESAGNYTHGEFTVKACPPVPCVKPTPTPTPPASSARTNKLPVNLSCPTPHPTPKPPTTGVGTAGPQAPWMIGVVVFFFVLSGAIGLVRRKA